MTDKSFHRGQRALSGWTGRTVIGTPVQLLTRGTQSTPVRTLPCVRQL
jgi:hypothetical protein